MQRSLDLIKQALEVIPGGVNSPVRAFGGVGGSPLFFKKGVGAHVFDEDDRQFIDYVSSWGPLILGHAHPEVLAAVIETAQNGLTFGAPTELEITLARMIIQLMPSIEQVRMVSSGTEAAMSAIRLARGFTGRNKIIKFEGCYHGHTDALLVKAGSGALTFGCPSSPGVPKDFTQHTLIADFNDLSSVEALFSAHGDDIALVIVEPVAGNMGCVLPNDDFLPGLRALCDQHQSLLILDEVISGFRVALGGAQSVYQIKPDLTVLGKIIGGGMPVGAFGGRREIMAELSPIGPVYQAGTLSGNPVACAAGITTLQEIMKPGFYEALNAKTQTLAKGFKAIADKHGVPLCVNQIGAMLGVFFTDQPQVTNFQEVMRCDVERYRRHFHAMLAGGVYFAPSAFESVFLSSAHSDDDIQRTLDVFEKSVR